MVDTMLLAAALGNSGEDDGTLPEALSSSGRIFQTSGSSSSSSNILSAVSDSGRVALKQLTKNSNRRRGVVQPLNLSSEDRNGIKVDDVGAEMMVMQKGNGSSSSSSHSQLLSLGELQQLTRLYFSNTTSRRRVKFTAIFIGLVMSFIRPIVAKRGDGFNTMVILLLSSNCHFMIAKERSFVTLFAIVITTIFVDIYNTFFSTSSNFIASILITFTIISTKSLLLYDVFFSSISITNSNSNSNSGSDADMSNGKSTRSRARTFLVRRVRLFIAYNFQSSNYMRYIRGRVAAIGLITIAILLVNFGLLCLAVTEFRIADDPIFFKPSQGVSITTFLIVKVLLELVIFASIAYDAHATMLMFHFGIIGRKNVIVKRLLYDYNHKGAAIPYFYAFDYNRFELIGAVKFIGVMWGLVGQVTLYSSTALSSDSRVRAFESVCIFALLISDYYVPALFVLTAIMYKSHIISSQRSKIRNAFYDSDDSELDDEAAASHADSDDDGMRDIVQISTTANALNGAGGGPRVAGEYSDDCDSSSHSGDNTFDALWESLEIVQSFSCDVSLPSSMPHTTSRSGLLTHFERNGFIVDTASSRDETTNAIYLKKVLLTIQISSASGDFAAIITLNKNNKDLTLGGGAYVYTLNCTSKSTAMSILTQNIAKFDLTSIFILEQS